MTEVPRKVEDRLSFLRGSVSGNLTSRRESLAYEMSSMSLKRLFMKIGFSLKLNSGMSTITVKKLQKASLSLRMALFLERFSVLSR